MPSFKTTIEIIHDIKLKTRKTNQLFTAITDPTYQLPVVVKWFSAQLMLLHAAVLDIQ